MRIFVGSYTNEEQVTGLNVVELDTESGKMKLQERYRVDNALYFARSGSVLYSNCTDGLVSFRVEGDRLEAIDRLSLGMRSMCHVATLAPDRITWTSYSDGAAGTIAVNDGKFGDIITHRHSGQGPNLPRQSSAHPHCAVPLPNGRGYAVCDLGLDSITVYPSGKVFKTEPAGAGPRHIVFHPNGRLAFVVFELWNLVASYELDDDQCPVRLLDMQPTLISADHGRGVSRDLAGAIRLTPDNRRIVVSNRGEESLVVFDLDEATGKLKFCSRIVLPGSWPRDFLFVADDLVVVAMERSGDLHSLRYDAKSGRFAKLSTMGGWYRPVALIV